jgi:hypothetical protein
MDSQLSSSFSQPSPETMTADAGSDLEHQSAAAAGGGRRPLTERSDQDIISVEEVSDDDDDEIVAVSPNPPADVQANRTASSTWKSNYSGR